MSRSSLVPSLCLVAAGLGLVACVDGGDSTVVILQNQLAEGACTVASAPTPTFVSAGVIDASSNRGYVFTPVARNFAVASDGQERLRIAFVEGARVEIAFAEHPDLFDQAVLDGFRTSGLTRFEVPMSGPINPGATTSFVFEVVPAELLAEIEARLPTISANSTLLQVSVRLVGTLGDSGFESQVFRYPVDVCDGCLVNLVGACSALSSAYQPVNTGGACNPAQDAPIDCCLDGAGAPVCPAVGTAAAQ